MAAPAWTRSLRVRLTLTYSLALFAVGALVLAAIYLGVSSTLDDDTVTARFIARDLVPRDGGVAVVATEFEAELRTLESLVNERALDQLRTWSFGALAAMFLASLVIGWIVAGRALRPIGRITDVAEEIQATDLSRRIGLRGPDDELTRLASTFDAMLDRLDRAFEGQRRFVHEASHELRNPLATIRTNLEVALADPHADVDDLRQTAEVVDRTTDRMGRVVDDLLLFARSEMPERELTLLEFDPLVEEVAEEFAGAAEANSVSVVVRPASTRPIRGEAGELRRVVANLLANAIEHTPSGSTVVIATEDSASGVRLRVADEGSGIPEGQRDSVFRRGWRSAAARARRPGGSGLGLTIVRQVVEAHGGSITVESGPRGRGTAMVVDLPAPNGHRG